MTTPTNTSTATPVAATPAPVSAKVTTAKAVVKPAATPKPAVTTKTLAPKATTKGVKTLRRGVKKAEVVKIVEAFKFPTEPFTLKQIVNAIGVDHWYIVAYVKTNARVVGDAPKVAGVRGKSAKLYQFTAK